MTPGSGRVPGPTRRRSSLLDHPATSLVSGSAYGSCRTRGRRPNRVAHRSLDGAHTAPSFGKISTTLPWLGLDDASRARRWRPLSDASVGTVSSGLDEPVRDHVRSALEVTNVSQRGFWVLVGGRELFLPFKQLPHPTHIYWPDLDVDLSIESIEFPERFPLVSRARPKDALQRARAKRRLRSVKRSRGGRG